MENIMPYLRAFVVGGCFCVAAQLLIDKTRLTPARVLVAYVCAGVLLTVLGLFEPLAEFAGCGATVPLVGFGYSLASGVRSAVAERGLLGALTGPLTATAAGIEAALIFGWITAVIFRGKPK